MKHNGIRTRVGIAVSVVAIAAMGVLSGCGDEANPGGPAPSLTPSEKNLSPTGGNLFSPAGPTTTTSVINNTNNKPATPPGPPGHGTGRGAAGPNGPAGSPGGGGPGGGR